MKGKHASASSRRRMEVAEERAADLERQLKKVKQELVVSQRVADRVHGMEDAVSKLKFQLDLATSEEVDRLNEMVLRLREELEQRDGAVAKIQKRWEQLLKSEVIDRSTPAAQRFDQLMGTEPVTITVGVDNPTGKLDAEGVQRIQRARGLRK